MRIPRLSIVIGLFLVACQGALHAGEIERIQAKGELVVSINKGYPPFSMGTDSQPSGLDIDLGALLADYLGVKVRFVRPDHFGEQIPRLLAGESDIVIAAMTRTVERGLKVAFTAPYFEVSQAALVRRELAPVGADSYFDLLDIEGLRLGVKADTTHEQFARELFPEDAITRFPTAEDAAQALLDKAVDAVVADSPFVEVWQKTHPEHYIRVAALLAPVTQEYYAFAVRQGDPVFLDWLNIFIDQIKIDGTLGLLTYEYFEQMKWAGGKVPPKPDLTRAEILKNRFVAGKQKRIEERRKAMGTDKIRYD